MRLKLSFAPVLLAVVVSLVVHSATAEPSLQSPHTLASSMAPLAIVPSSISYQGRLADNTGASLNGAYDFVFQFWNDATGGSQVGTDVVLNDAPVQDGLFTVQLDIPHADVNGQALWVGIQVGGQWLAPRQPLLPVAYALSLRPGARIEGSSTQAILTAINTGLGTAVKAQGSVIGLEGYGMTGVRGQGDVGVEGDGPVGVRGNSPSGGYGVEGNGPTGMGVVGTSTTGVGVRGTSQSGMGLQANSVNGLALQATGQRGIEANGVITGVLGVASGSAGRGVVGFADNYSGIGVFGRGAFGTGVLGDGELGVRGTSHLGTGVRGEGPTGVSGATTVTGGYGVTGTSASGRGVNGTSTSGRGVHGNSTSSFGVYGESEANYGVYGLSTNSRGVYGSGNTGVYGNSTVTGGYGLYTNDNLFVGGNCTGCKLALIAQNGDGQTLEPGDMVALAGLASPLPATPDPVILVRRADATSQAAVIGVVTGRFVPPVVNATGDTVEDAYSIDQAAAPNEYITVVYHGLVRIKVDASHAAIEVGDTVGLSTASGQVQKLDPRVPIEGVVGRALEPLTQGSGLIWILIVGR